MDERPPAPETGLPPVLGPSPRLLVLGSMPGRRSLDEQRYYAHPRNLFWPLMGELAGFAPDLDYPLRLQRLAQAGVVLWDVLAACVRPGSLDASIVRGSERPNPIPALLAAHPGIAAVAFNGGAAWTLFRRHVAGDLPAQRLQALTLLRLPSTSPANAGVPLQARRAAWAALAPWLRA